MAAQQCICFLRNSVSKFVLVAYDSLLRINSIEFVSKKSFLKLYPLLNDAVVKVSKTRIILNIG